MVASQRAHTPTEWTCSSIFTSRPSASIACHHRLARLIAVQPGIRPGFRRHVAVFADDDGGRQFVAQAHLGIIRVVRRRDLHRAGAEGEIDDSYRR